MNTKHNHQIRTATYTTVMLIIACASTAAPAIASPPRGNTSSGPALVSPFAEPIAALDGMTLAQYIQQHQDGDPRTGTGF